MLCPESNWGAVRADIDQARPSFNVVLMSPAFWAYRALQGMQLTGYTLSTHMPYPETRKQRVDLDMLIETVIRPRLKSAHSTILSA